ncbi:S1 family peptidase [Rhizobium sp. 11_C7_N12_5]|uniref:S1 family peptidase n=1 Tax=Rhizobium sp. 11_C7_N12_5 TaxID=3240770 RepID=UPI003F1F9BD5
MSLSIAENLLYTTVKLTSLSDGSPVSTGTGFFMYFQQGDNRDFLTLITNKHVVEGASEVVAVCHIAAGDAPSGQFIAIAIPINQYTVVGHPSSEVDLCALNFAPIIMNAQQRGLSLFFRPLNKADIPIGEEWDYFDAIEDVTMIGCPNGISDETNNLPIVRRGITATALSKRYNGSDQFMVDMACFPGSSGSPIFLYDRHGYFDRKANTYFFKSRLKLVGVLFAGPQVTNDGTLVLAQAPRIAVQSMMHLGNALRSTAILDLEQEMMKLDELARLEEAAHVRTSGGAAISAENYAVSSSSSAISS